MGKTHKNLDPSKHWAHYDLHMRRARNALVVCMIFAFINLAVQIYRLVAL